jgi:hypothetical protein
MGQQTPQLVTVCIVARAAEIQRARELSFAWIKLRRPSTRQTADEMLPTPLSPTGAGIPTHWLCVLTLTVADADHMQVFIETRSVPVSATVVGPQDDVMDSRLANRDLWLARNGLRVVA